jgi:hypothetical protein
VASQAAKHEEEDMNSNQFRRWLQRKGCVIKPKPGTGHVIVFLGDRWTELPMHGGSQQLSKWLIRKIMKDLGIPGQIPN